MEDLFESLYNTTDGKQNYVITLAKSIPQTFTHTFVDGRTFQVFIHYNRLNDLWVLDLYLVGENGTLTPQLLGVELTEGLNLFVSHKYQNLGELYLFAQNYRTEDSPSYNTLNQFYILWRH